jgi:gamma-glutamyltranspeptidase/glutathione hydrolase/leukotriene-C4 hydrolase
MNIVPAVLQVFVNQFILGMEPLAAVESPRVYHKVPDSFQYINVIYILV